MHVPPKYLFAMQHYASMCLTHSCANHVSSTPNLFPTLFTFFPTLSLSLYRFSLYSKLVINWNRENFCEQFNTNSILSISVTAAAAAAAFLLLFLFYIYILPILSRFRVTECVSLFVHRCCHVPFLSLRSFTSWKLHVHKIRTWIYISMVD